MDENKYDKRAKALRYKFDKKSFHLSRWETLDRKEKDYWRGRVQQWEQDKATLNKKDTPRLHHNSSHTER